MKKTIQQKTSDAIRTLEYQSRINRGLPVPTVREHREKLAKLEREGARINSEILRIKNSNY